MKMTTQRRTVLLSCAMLIGAACTRKSEEGGAAPSPSSSENSAGKSAARSSVTVKGSDTMVQLGQRWAETYMKDHQNASIQVTGGGSGTGIAALINGGTDICNASRAMKDKEKADVKAKRGVDPVETKVALDALAIYVNAASPVQEIDLAQLASVYLGQATNWKDVGGKDHKITLYGRENNSGTYGYFKEHVLGDKDFAAGVQTLPGTSAVVNAVKGDEFGIGYGGIGYSSGVKLLRVKKTKDSPAIEPKLETAKDGSYPISRYLYIYTAGAPKGTAKEFIDWIVSAPGQNVVTDVGYFPLPK
ncbi:MAG: phosphate ABC transporter substrate-binding protein [Polyangiales bacterium]